MDPETGCRYDFQLPLSSERPSMYQATIWVGSTGVGNEVSSHFTHAWASRRRVDTRRIPFLTGMSICQLSTTSYPSLRPGDTPIVLLRWKNYGSKIVRFSKTPSMDAFKALQATHSNCALRWVPSQLGRMYATRKSANSGCHRMPKST
jgi:hypothetical protein